MAYAEWRSKWKNQRKEVKKLQRTRDKTAKKIDRILKKAGSFATLGQPVPLYIKDQIGELYDDWNSEQNLVMEAVRKLKEV